MRQIKANKAANLNARSVANKADDVAEDLARSASRNKSSQLNHTTSEAGNHQGAGRPGQTHKELENDLNRKKVADVSKETSHQTPPPVEKGRHVEGEIKKVQPEKISDKLWDTHINAIDELRDGQIKGGHNFDSIITDLQRKYGLSDDDVSKMLVKSKEIIPPGGIHEIKYKGPQLSLGQTWADNPLPLKRDGSQELMLRNKNKTKTVFDPAVYDPNTIRAGMDDALSSVSDEVRGGQSFKGSAMVRNKSGKVEEMWFEFIRDKKTGELSTVYPISNLKK